MGGDSSAPEHSRSVEQSLGAGQELRWSFLGSSQKTGHPRSLWHPAQYSVTAPTLALPFLTGNFRRLHVSSVSQRRSSFAVDLQLHLVPGVFLESAYPGIHAQVPCYEQGWVRPRVSLRKWAGRRSPVLTQLVFYI